ncbi:MAG: VOC family protein [Bacteroidales bacterium]|jgi:PhnB protein|nr:VOC family protein [Bacteroidales bacterium]
MKSVEPYLIFNGNCEEAFTFYQSVFGGDMKIMRFRDMPEKDKKNVPQADMDRVVHVLLPVSKAVSLMGSDSLSSMKMKTGDNVALTLNVESRTEAEQIFGKLSGGGKVTMPLGKTFWAELYGMVTDRFGINWMVNYYI